MLSMSILSKKKFNLQKKEDAGTETKEMTPFEKLKEG